jgi:hypothetical protein
MPDSFRHNSILFALFYLKNISNNIYYVRVEESAFFLNGFKNTG